MVSSFQRIHECLLSWYAAHIFTCIRVKPYTLLHPNSYVSLCLLLHRVHCSIYLPEVVHGICAQFKQRTDLAKVYRTNTCWLRSALTASGLSTANLLLSLLHAFAATISWYTATAPTSTIAANRRYLPLRRSFFRGKNSTIIVALGKTSPRVVHLPGHPLCHQEGTDPAVSPSARHQPLLPVGALYRRPGYPQRARPLVAPFIPRKNPTMTR